MKIYGGEFGVEDEWEYGMEQMTTTTVMKSTQFRCKIHLGKIQAESACKSKERTKKAKSETEII